MEPISTQPHLPYVYNVRNSSHKDGNRSNANNAISSNDINVKDNNYNTNTSMLYSGPPVSFSRDNEKPASKICTVYDINSRNINNGNVNGYSNVSNDYNNKCNKRRSSNELYESVEICHRGRRRLICSAELEEDVFDIFYTLPDGTPLSSRSTVCMDQHILARIRDDLRRFAKKLDNPESAMPERGPIFLEDIARAVTENDQLRYTVEPELIKNVCLPVLNGNCNINNSNVEDNVTNSYSNNTTSNNNVNSKDYFYKNVNCTSLSNNYISIPRSSTSPDAAVQHRTRSEKNDNDNSNCNSLPILSLEPMSEITNTSKSSKTSRSLNAKPSISINSGVPYGLSNFVTMNKIIKETGNERLHTESEESLPGGLSQSNGLFDADDTKETVATSSNTAKKKKVKKYRVPELDDIEKFIKREQARSQEYTTALEKN